MGIDKKAVLDLINDFNKLGGFKDYNSYQYLFSEVNEMFETKENLEPHLISVEQELPKIGEYVLCETATRHFGMYCRYHVCKLVDKDKWVDKPHFDWDRNGFPNVIAWMPLPKSYKGVTK